MAKEKKELTIKEQRDSARKKQLILFASEFAVIPIPFVVMGIVNAQEWFITNPEGWRIGLGGGIAMALCSLATFLVSKQKENPNLTGGYISIILGWYALTFVFFLLSSILEQIYIIMAICGSGMLSAFGLDVESKRYKKEYLRLDESLKMAQAEIDKEQAKEEIKNVKLRIKK